MKIKILGATGRAPFIGIPTAQARQLAQVLIEKADEIDKRKS